MMKFIFGVLVLMVASLSTTRAYPYTAEEFEAFGDICMNLLDPPPAYRHKFSNHQYPDHPITHRHFYCMAVLAGGIDFTLERLQCDKIFVQYGGDFSLGEFRQKCAQCDRRAKETSRNQFEMVYRYYQCFEKQFLEIFYESNGDEDTCDDQLATVERFCMDLFGRTSDNLKECD